MSGHADPAILEAEEYRAAAREIAEASDHAHERKLAAFMRLAKRAREEAEAPQIAERAVYGEFQRFLYGDPPEGAADPVERACRGLSREGYARCPSCRRPLPGEDDYSRWALMRRGAVEWYAARQGAV